MIFPFSSRVIPISSAIILLLCMVGCGRPHVDPGPNLTDPGEVVVYVALDRVYAEPILEDFQKKTKIRVRAVYDTEATKTVSLVGRLLAEEKAPLCDVFWNNELVHTLRLQQKGLLQPYDSPQARNIPKEFRDPKNHWTGFAARARVLVYHPDSIAEEKLPPDVAHLAEAQWKGKIVLANARFGTTRTHVAALFAAWGPEKATRILNAVVENSKVVPGNAVVKNTVAQGTVPLGLTDTDDVYSGQQDGQPIKQQYIDRNNLGVLVIPNTLAQIKNGPNPTQAKQLIDFLLQPGIEERLAKGRSAQIPVRPSVPRPKHIPLLSTLNPMKLSPDELLEGLEKSQAWIDERF